MSELTIIFFLFSIITCVIIAIGVWLIAKSKIKAGPAISESSSRVDTCVGGRRNMQIGDWANTLVLIILGILLGVVIDALMQLLTTAFWPVAVIIPLLFLAALLFGEVLDGIVDQLFPSGVRPARKPQRAARTPLPRILSLPIGLIIGIILARLGFSDTIFQMIS